MLFLIELSNIEMINLFYTLLYNLLLQAKKKSLRKDMGVHGGSLGVVFHNKHSNFGFSVSTVTSSGKANFI